MNWQRGIPYIPWAVILVAMFLPVRAGFLIIGLSVIALIARVFEEPRSSDGG